MRRREKIHKNGLLNENRMRVLQKIGEIVKASNGRFNLTDD